MSEQQQVLQVNWIHNHTVERWLREMAKGDVLNVCCGMSRVGRIRIDIAEGTNRTEAGDLFHLSFPSQSFDSVICDAPFSYFNRFDWIADLAKIARKRFILSADRTIIRLPRKDWRVRLFAFQMQRSAHDSYLRLYYVFDRLNGSLST